MKPTSRQVMHSSSFLSGNLNSSFGTKNTVACIKGSTRALGKDYRDATVVLYSKATLLPLAVKKPDQNYEYQFYGLNQDLTCFVVGLDDRKKFNAVIQDNVVPK